MYQRKSDYAVGLVLIIRGTLRGIGELSSTVAAWTAYEKMVQETSE